MNNDHARQKSLAALVRLFRNIVGVRILETRSLQDRSDSTLLFHNLDVWPFDLRSTNMADINLGASLMVFDSLL